MLSPYRILKPFVRLVENKMLYTDTRVIGKENVPETGSSVLIASDHQNGLCDAIGILMAVDDRKVHFMVRADIFSINPLTTKLFYSLGLLPAFRLQYQGSDSLDKNTDSFNKMESILLEGNSIGIFPEACHQDGHWLGGFSYGYTRMAFEAAEKDGFSKEIFILPACNHYSEYSGLRNKAIYRFGTPVSLKPYYELYKTKPRTAQREVNKLVRQQISDMMLNVEDAENYASIDFLRQNGYGRHYAASLGLDPDDIEQKLEADKKLVSALSGKDAPYDKVNSYISDLDGVGCDDRQVEKNPGMLSVLCRAVLALILLPIAVFCVWPSLVSWFVPRHITKKNGDMMMFSTIALAANVLLIFPLATVINLVAGWIVVGVWAGILWALSIPLLCMFEWDYIAFVRTLAKDFRYLISGEDKKRSLSDKRKEIFTDFDTLLGVSS